MDTFSQLSTYLTESEVEVLARCESVIEKGLRSFIDVGTALLAIRDNKLYRGSYPTFEAYCQDKWNISRPRAYQLMEAAGIMEDLSTQVDTLPEYEKHVRPLSRVDPEMRAELWQTALDTAPNGKVTGPHVDQVVDEYQNGKQEKYAQTAISQRPDYDGDEWYTPGKYIDAARVVMGGIDLDPASCDEAQGMIKAMHYFTKEDNGLNKDWFGRVWVNPPYSAPLIDQFVEKLISEYLKKNVDEAIILTNNSSDTRWFHSLLSRFPACFTRGRVQFWRAGEETFGARQGQTLFYLGDKKEIFLNSFCEFGIIVEAL